MENSYLEVHYNERLRPYTKYPALLCEHLAGRYFGAHTGRLLDVCCGRGEHMEIFRRMGFETYGVDKESVAQRKDLEVRVADVDLQNLPFEDGFFDFVMIKSAIEHIRNVYHLTENVYRVLKPGGKVVILTADWKTCYKVFYDDVDHKTPFSKYSLHDLLVRYDFRDVDVQYFYHLPHTWKSRLFHLSPRTIAFLFPIDFSQTVKHNFFTKLIRFSREKQILGYGRK